MQTVSAMWFRSSSSHLLRGMRASNACQVALRAPLQVTVRHFGIMDTLTGYATSQIDQTKDQQFAKMIKTMADSPSWSLRQWKDVLEQQLGSWMTYIPGVSSSNEVTQVKKFKSILDALSEDELNHPEKINSIVRERVSAKSGQPAEDVARMVLFYKHTLILHSWLQIKKAAGEPLPSTDFEMMRMQESDPRMQPLIQKINAKKRKTGRGRGLPF